MDTTLKKLNHTQIKGLISQAERFLKSIKDEVAGDNESKYARATGMAIGGLEIIVSELKGDWMLPKD